ARTAGSRRAGRVRPRRRLRLRECGCARRGPRPATKPGSHLVLAWKMLHAFGAAKVVFDRSSEDLAYRPIACDIRMKAIRSASQTVRIGRIRDGGVGVAEQDPKDFRQVLDPRVEGEDVPRRARARGIVRKARARNP